MKASRRLPASERRAQLIEVGRAAFAKPGELASLVTGTDEAFPAAAARHPTWPRSTYRQTH